MRKYNQIHHTLDQGWGTYLLSQTDRQTMLVYFTWPTKRPRDHQCQLTMGQSQVALTL